MTDITFSNSLRDQFRAPDAYVEQVGNVLLGLFRMLGWWVVLTTTYSSAAAIIALIIQDLSSYSLGNMQAGLRLIVTFTAPTAALACLVTNIGKFRNVFSDRAKNEVERFKTMKEKIESQIDTTESLLVQYGLVTEAEVERRATTVSGTSSTS